MSLFQARDYWSTTVGADEEFVEGGMVLANVDNAPSQDEKIVTGSLAGALRIYYPRGNGYKIEDLMLEQNLGAPILQLLVGNLIPHSPTMLGLAVLHPRKVTVYKVEAKGSGGSADYFQLTKAYEHPLGIDGLHFTAYNMTIGPFGGQYGKDFLCVQSMDGQLAFYEQDHFAFIRKLENCLVPGPLLYVPKTDCIVTANSEMCVEAYKYQVLAAASAAKPTDDSVGGGGGGGGAGGRDGPAMAASAMVGGRTVERRSGISVSKGLKTAWAVNIGEYISHLALGRYTAGIGASQVDILVVGEHTVFALRESGGATPVRLQKRLGYHPSAMAMYKVGRSAGRPNEHNMMIASHTSQLHVYSDTKLVWAARMTDLPIALAVGKFGGLAGLVVSLDDVGKLGLSYMGSDPPTTAVGGSGDTKELDYEEMDEEHKHLLQLIRESQSENRTEPADKLLLRAQVPSRLDDGEDDDEDAMADRAALREAGGGGVMGGVGMFDGTGVGAAAARVTVRLFVSYTGSGSVKDVHLTIKHPQCVRTKQTTIIQESVEGATGARATPIVIPIVFRAHQVDMPADLTITVAAAYLTAKGEPRTSQVEFKLPLCIACRLVPPVKTNTFKFTLETNKPPPQLASLFTDMFDQPGVTEDAINRITATSTNVLSFQYYNGADATILVSKSAGRYRVQSGDLESLWLVSSELVRRLREYFSVGGGAKKGGGGGGGGGGGADGKGAGDEEFEILYQQPLPLADFFTLIDEHFAARQALVAMYATLNDRAHQFRLVQKRLLVRFKDRNPAPLNRLDVLMHGTHEQIVDLASKALEAQKHLRSTSNRLSCATHLLLMLMSHRFSLDTDNYKVLAAHLSPQIVDSVDQGWEECTDAAMTHLLRTSLAKSSKDAATVPQPLAMPADTQKLKKHITIVCDRLAKGAQLYRPARRGRKA